MLNNCLKVQYIKYRYIVENNQHFIKFLINGRSIYICSNVKNLIYKS